MYSANTIVFTAGALAFMLDQPQADFVRFLPLLIVSITIQYFGRKIHANASRESRRCFFGYSAQAQKILSGARVIRAYVQEEAEDRAFEIANQEYIKRSLKLVRLMGMLWPTLETSSTRHCACVMAGRS
jgi:ATP-binding cassette subfamily B protein